MAGITSDEPFVEQIRTGADSAFAGIVEQYSAEVAALANRLLGWPGDVEDITQEVFLSAFIGLKKFRRDCSIKSWLFTITINKCRTYRYKQMLSRKPLLTKKSKSVSTANPAHSNLINAEESEKVRRAVAALPAKYREPVVLRYLQELESDQIREILGISVNTLNVRLNRARERLRQNLAELMEL